MENTTHYSSRIQSFGDRLKKLKIPAKWVLVLMGVASTIWFLVRVIPKPSRAGYPCMKAAAPIMSSFFVYILSLSGMVLAFRKAGTNMRKARYVAATLCIVTGIVLGVVFTIKDSKTTLAVTVSPAGTFTPNAPMGSAKGVRPGRVVWAWNKDATNEACTNEWGHFYWQPENYNQDVVSKMVQQSILSVTGSTTLLDSWKLLFKYHNKKKTGVEKEYTAGEKIFIKINQGTADWNSNAAGGFSVQQLSWNDANNGAAEASPAVVLELLRQLVNTCGVAETDIYVGDPYSHIFKHNFDVWYDEFPDVNYIDRTSSDFDRMKITRTTEVKVTYSDNGARMPASKNQGYLYNEVIDAAYMINVANFKPHSRAGISLCAKNHFGTRTESATNGAGNLHPSLVGDNPDSEGYGKYRVLVDLMGNKYLGKNTMLFVIDGLFGGGSDETKKAVKWINAPFNNDWTSSVFMSQDPVAIESVCHDFLRFEFDGVTNHNSINNAIKNGPIWFGVDDYLHQAADPSTWPTQIKVGAKTTAFGGYRPNGDGVAITSLGVHEHWNNPTDKKYTRNLGTGNGIELKKVDGITPLEAEPDPDPEPTGISNVTASYNLRLSPVPVRDVLTISVDDSNLKGTVSVRIYSVNGGLVYQKNFAGNYSSFNQQIGLEQLSSGVYLIEVNTNLGKIVKRISKL